MFGDRMQGRLHRVKQEDLFGEGLVIVAVVPGTKRRPGRSQGARSSVDAGVMPVEQRGAGGWMSCDHAERKQTRGSVQCG